MSETIAVMTDTSGAGEAGRGQQMGAAPAPGQAAGGQAAGVQAAGGTGQKTVGGASGGAGLRFQHHFSTPGTHPFDAIDWDRRSAVITNDKGETIFAQHDVEVPSFWSQLATNVVISKYFHGPKGSPERESSVRQLIDRVTRTLADWGKKDGYFETDSDAEAFYGDLTYLMLHQMACFNSPVWFNMGVPSSRVKTSEKGIEIDERPQCSACFINSVDDSMESILGLARTEGLLFKYGSGTGTNFSTLRGSSEPLAGGGIASGPVSFMRGFDAFAGVIKSGGKTRRSAKMVILDCDHPDIEEFIECKHSEEKKAWALMDAGYSGGLSGEAYNSIFFQNSNNSVRVTEDFMSAVERNDRWALRSRTNGEPIEWVNARDVLRQMAECAHACGDPGIQYDTTINDWHTCADTTRINASNPCSEYMFVDDSACNLASLNLMKFRRADASFDVRRFRAAVRVMITAMDIIVDNASYPTDLIERNSHKYRPLGLGYANLGALLMSRGVPYDSDEGRATAGAITALLSGEAYRTSAEIASRLGPCEAWTDNRSSFLRVIGKHRSAVSGIDGSQAAEELLAEAQTSWDEAFELGEKAGYKNCQISVLAPTGTIAFMMDCDTTGVEPDIALVKYKKLSGGGLLKIVNNTVPEALRSLGYSAEQIEGIKQFVASHDTIEGAPELNPAHLPVFDCAFKPAKGERSIHWRGHLRMMAAVQPFLSGAISKTVNLPETVSVDDIMECYLDGWKAGLKAVAVYRDGSKRVQPLALHESETDSKQDADASPQEKADAAVSEAIAESGKHVHRRRLPDERASITHKFSVAGHEGYITVGMYEDGTPGEIFIVMSKEGSTVSGLMDGFATAISLALQYGVPLKELCRKFSHMRFEPSGFSGNPEIGYAKSILDYIFRWLALKFLPAEERGETEANGAHSVTDEASPTPGAAPARSEGNHVFEHKVFENHSDAPPCPDCGQIMVRNGACYKCFECGATSGCS